MVMSMAFKKNHSRRARTAAPTAAATAILDVAEQLAQTRGYNGFSFADIAAPLGVTKASLHYHFASKAELGRALIERYRSSFGAALQGFDLQAKPPLEKLRQYVALYNSVLNDERMCLCGMLAAEQATLPAPMCEGLRLFFDDNEAWLTAVLERGLADRSFLFRESAQQRARIIVAALEGAMLVARAYGEPGRFKAAAAFVLADLVASSAPMPHRKISRAAAARAQRGSRR